MKHFFRVLALVAVMGLLSTGIKAQQDNDKGKQQGDRDRSKLDNDDEIIIMKKGNKDSKVTVEIKNGEITVNGRPISEFDDNDVVVRKRRSQSLARVNSLQSSPFRGNFNFNYDGNADAFALYGNKALLGVITEKSDDGVRISSVTKGSAAEKAGLKENDIITKVDETAVSSPQDLTKAIGKFKPEDKTVISYKRDKKEQKTTISLGKRDDANITFRDNQEFHKNFNMDMLKRDAEAWSNIRGAGTKLGIKAQDTEDGKGVKVLDVEDESNAEKSGVKEGDIITEFDGKAVNSAMELSDAARGAKEKNSIRVKLNRNGKAQDLEIRIPKKLKTASL